MITPKECIALSHNYEGEPVGDVNAQAGCWRALHKFLWYRGLSEFERDKPKTGFEQVIYFLDLNIKPQQQQP
jgi:hypothetical protein